MSKTVMSDSLAKKELDDILDHLDCDKGVVEYKLLLSLLMKGKLSWIKESGRFKLKLFGFVQDANKVEINEITLSMLKGQDLIDAERNNRSETESGIAYIAAAADLLLGSCYKMTTKDIKNSQAVVRLFL